EHLLLQGSVRRSESRRSAACLHQPGVFWLWRDRPERPLCPLARLRGVWDEPASGPQRRPEYPAGGRQRRGAGQAPQALAWAALAERRLKDRPDSSGRVSIRWGARTRDADMNASVGAAATGRRLHVPTVTRGKWWRCLSILRVYSVEAAWACSP